MTKLNFSSPQTYIYELNQYSSALPLKRQAWQEGKLGLLMKKNDNESEITVIRTFFS